MDGEPLFKVKITAIGEVRDAEGNLLSSEPVEAEMILTQSQLDELQKAGGE